MGTFIPTTEYPDNRHAFCQVDETDEIVIGGTATHIFILDFDYIEMCREANWFQIFYRQSVGGTQMTFDVQSSNVTVELDEINEKTKITVFIDEDTSRLFDSHRNTYAQIKLFMNDDTIVYGKKNKIKVIDALDYDYEPEVQGE